MTPDDYRIVPTAEEYIEGFARAVDRVARERRYLAFVEGPGVEKSRPFVRSLIAGAGVQLLALNAAGDVVGWCDIIRYPFEGFRHGGRLGMGLVPEARGHGLGERLARETIARARELGYDRIELEVFSTNERAIRLYERIGFVHEGVKRGARILDGTVEDNVMMALVRGRSHDARAAIAALHERWVTAVARGDADGLAGMLTDDYEVWTHGIAGLRGPDAAVRAMKSALATYIVDQRFDPEETIVSGDWAFARGHERMQLTPTAGGPTRAHEQRAFLVMRRGSDGEWRYARGMTNGLPA